LFISVDRGRHWVDLRSNMPTLAINDLVVHPRDNDLVLATHGRGVWILDDVSALQELATAASGGGGFLFTPQPADQMRTTNLKAHMGDMVFRGENPPAGAIIDYWLPQDGVEVTLTVHDGGGREVNRLVPTTRRGVNRVTWNLRQADVTPDGGRGAAPPAGGRGGRGRGGRGGGGARLQGMLVEPGTYTVRLVAGGQITEKPVEVREDPRIGVSPADRREWAQTLEAIAEAWRRAAALVTRLQASGSAEDRRLASSAQELLGGLYGAVSDYTGRPTVDQLSQLEYLRGVVERLER
jgi:hypothetical protein